MWRRDSIRREKKKRVLSSVIIDVLYMLLRKSIVTFERCGLTFLDFWVMRVMRRTRAAVFRSRCGRNSRPRITCRLRKIKKNVEYNIKEAGSFGVLRDFSLV